MTSNIFGWHEFHTMFFNKLNKKKCNKLALFTVQVTKREHGGKCSERPHLSYQDHKISVPKGRKSLGLFPLN